MRTTTNTSRGSVRNRLLILLTVFALVATACSGESTSVDTDEDETTTTEAPESDDSGESDDTASDDAPETTDAPESDDGGEESATESVFAEDFHGGIFADFQAEYDRGQDPFSSLDNFCSEHDAAEGRTDSMAGVTADTIEVGHVFQDLNKLAEIGFGVPVGDPELMFETFLQVINEQCGGIRGRQLELKTSVIDPLGDTVALNTQVCIELTEDFNATFIMNSTGGLNETGALCIAEEHNTVMSASVNLSDETLERGSGLIMTIPLSQDDGLRALVRKAVADGVLEGRTVGVVYPDTPGIPSAVENTLIPELEAAGFAPVVSEVIGCNGGTVCAAGMIEAAAKLQSEGVDAVFPPLNILSLPPLVAEMANLGYAPGDVLFFQSALNSQNGDLVSSKVSANGGEEAAALYNGAYIVDTPFTGLYQETDTVPPFNDVCINTYAENGGEFHDFFAADQNTPAGMVASVCTHVRIMARVLYHAGENPTPESIAEAINNLGPVDTNGMVPGYVNGNGGIMNWPQTTRWTFPCEYEDAYDENNTCIVSQGDFAPFE